MTHAALSPLIGSEFDEFLGASIGEDRNGMGSLSFPRLRGSMSILGKKQPASRECRGMRPSSD
jgi:hypothetical protein